MFSLCVWCVYEREREREREERELKIARNSKSTRIKQLDGFLFSQLQNKIFAETTENQESKKNKHTHWCFTFLLMLVSVNTDT